MTFFSISSIATQSLKGEGELDRVNVYFWVGDKRFQGVPICIQETRPTGSILLMDIQVPSSPFWLKYYYAGARMNFVSTSITSAALSSNAVTISGTGTANGVGGYTFTATVANGSPDSFAIVIRKPDGSTYYSAAPKNISGGNLVILPL